MVKFGAKNDIPALGRFTQPDTLIPGAGNPQAWNRYSYALNNPIRYIDPDGHFPIIPVIVFVGMFFFNGTSDSYQPNLSYEELDARQNSYNLGVGITVSALSVKSWVVEAISNAYDCSQGICDLSLMAPGSASLYDDVGDTFVHVSPSKYDDQIDELGLLLSKGQEEKKRIWITKMEFIEHITNPEDFETLLYNKTLWGKKKGEFAEGATIWKVDVSEATPAGVTNMTYRVPQWYLTKSVPRSKLNPVRKVNKPR